MGSSKIKTTDMTINPKDAVVESDSTEAVVVVKEREPRERSKKYISKRGMVDRTKFHSLADAIELVKKTSYSKFAGSISADLVMKDQKIQVDITFPHSTGQSKKVVIADDKLLKEIEAGKLDFDILVTAPDMMPKIAKFARVLGPKGLMPTPKMGTVTSDPKKKKKELEAGSMTIKTEKKAPLIHIVVGKTDMDTKKLAQNIQELIKRVNDKKVKKLVLSATMSPGVKVDLSEFTQD